MITIDAACAQDPMPKRMTRRVEPTMNSSYALCDPALSADV
jgi:hypothetical protein